MKLPSWRNFHLRICMVRSVEASLQQRPSCLWFPVFYPDILLVEFSENQSFQNGTRERLSRYGGQAKLLVKHLFCLIAEDSDHSHGHRQTTQSLAYHVMTTWNCSGTHGRQQLCYLQFHKRRFPQESVRQRKTKESLSCYITISNCSLL